jgi:hypothetical protein
LPDARRLLIKSTAITRRRQRFYHDSQGFFLVSEDSRQPYLRLVLISPTPLRQL